LVHNRLMLPQDATSAVETACAATIAKFGARPNPSIERERPRPACTDNELM
jgi:hypothetical protein